MNKKLILLIPFLMVISACNNAQEAVLPSSGEEVSESSEKETSTSIEESNEKTSSEEESSEEQSSESESSEEQSSEEEPNHESKTFVFKGSSSRQSLNAGANLEDTNPKNAFTALFNSEEEFLHDFTSSCVTFQLVGHQNDGITSLCIGTQKYDGEIALNFNVPIYKISFELENYYKKYNSGGSEQINYDSDSEVTVTLGNGLATENYDLGAETYEQVLVNGELTTSGTTNKVTFSNSAAQHRVYVHSLTITYVVE